MRHVIKKKEFMNPKPKCFACKSELIINRGNNDDIIYFDKHYYHKDCFIKMKEIKKKCFQCKKDIVNSIDNPAIYYDKHYMHTNCFLTWCNEKRTQKRKNALLNINKYQDEANREFALLQETKNISENKLILFHKNANEEIQKWFDGSDLCAFIKQTYDVKKVPWQRIKKVIDGDDKNDGIPVEDLLDMWDKKIDWLNSIAEKKKIKSPMTQEQRILYDLAILRNKYDSYLKWKEKQKILEVEQQSEKTEVLITQEILHTQHITQENIDTDNISDLVDDIFGEL